MVDIKDINYLVMVLIEDLGTNDLFSVIDLVEEDFALLANIMVVNFGRILMMDLTQRILNFLCLNLDMLVLGRGFIVADLRVIHV